MNQEFIDCIKLALIAVVIVEGVVLNGWLFTLSALSASGLFVFLVWRFCK
jgi:hypothetical protein